MTRILAEVMLIAVGFLLLAAVEAGATPITPDIRKIVDQPQQDSTVPFVPGVGWNEAGMAGDQAPAVNQPVKP